MLVAMMVPFASRRGFPFWMIRSEAFTTVSLSHAR
jgi:hypothetical protein